MPITVKHLGITDYQETLNAMQQFTVNREPTDDQIWLTEHYPVFTQGQAGLKEHILNPHHIPIVQSDRGGQITYHGPGQAVIYLLINMKSRKLGVRQFVSLIENSLIDYLSTHQITAFAQPQAPGIYIKNENNLIRKVASLGLRVKNGCTYHGMAINVDMDLTPFTYINPCGQAGLEMTQLKALGINNEPDAVAQHVSACFIAALNQCDRQQTA